MLITYHGNPAGYNENRAANNRVTRCYHRIPEAINNNFAVQMDSDHKERLSLIWVQMTASRSLGICEIGIKTWCRNPILQRTRQIF